MSTELSLRDEAKAMTIAGLMAGDTYREVQANVIEQLNETPSLSTLWEWFHEDEGRVTRRNEQRMALALERDLDIVYSAQTILQERLASGSVYEVNAVKGTAQDKINNRKAQMTVNTYGPTLIISEAPPSKDVEGIVIEGGKDG